MQSSQFFYRQMKYFNFHNASPNNRILSAIPSQRGSDISIYFTSDFTTSVLNVKKS